MIAAAVDLPREQVAAAPRATRIGNRYELIALLGKGGVGTVYKARDRDLEETVALKILQPRFARDESFKARFRREVKLARRVTHPNVARTYDLGEHGERRFLTMEFIDGRPLKELVVRGRRLEPDEIARIAMAVSDGLGAAHGAGVIHRDLKPDNIMIETTGRVVIMDFGIARVADSDLDTQRTTGTGVLGTPSYMAPEQLEAGGQVDHRADLYSLGAVLFHAFSRRPPWSGASVWDVIVARQEHPEPDIVALVPKIDPAWASLIRRAMAVDPADRFQTAGEFKDAIAGLVGRSGPADERAAAATDRFGELSGGWARTVAVLPFALRGESGEEYLAEGFTEELIDVLSMAEGIRVRPKLATHSFTGPGAANVRAIGMQLGVEVVVEGSIRPIGDQVRLVVRAIGVEDGFQIWAHRFQTTKGDLLSTADEVAARVAEALTVSVTTEPTLVPGGSESVDLYMKARFELNAGWYDNVRPAVDLFDRALAGAPVDARFLAGAAVAHARHALIADPSHVARADELASRALVVGPGRGDSHLAMAMVHFVQMDPVATIERVRRALELAGDLADAHQLLGRTLVETGPIDDGIVHLETALRLDPGLGGARGNLARALALRGDWKEARALLKGRELRENDRGAQQVLRERLALWLEYLGKSLPPSTDPIEYPDRDIGLATRLYREVRASGRLVDAQREEILAVADRYGPVSRLRAMALQLLAEFEIFAGHAEAGLDNIERSYEAGLFDRMWMKGCPMFRDLRRNARFRKLRRRVSERAGRTGKAS